MKNNLKILCAITLYFITQNIVHAQSTSSQESLQESLQESPQEITNQSEKKVLEVNEMRNESEDLMETKTQPYNFGVWVNYQQQFTQINHKFVTIGGPSFGFNLGKYILIGAGLYSAFGMQNFGSAQDHSFVYGGGIVGIRWNPHHPIVFRTQVLIGVIGFDKYATETPGLVDKRDPSFIVVPEISLDIRLVGYLFLSASASYHYIDKRPHPWKSMEGLEALSGNVTIGLSF